MRMIVVLIALLIVGLLINKQIEKSETNAKASAENTAINVPKVPTKPQDVQAFSKDMNQFVEGAAAEQKKEIEQSAQ
ncbi:MAG TPA: hypothetical protein VFM46_05405 [Pseudomonadales bacterium]|nr:hypothetical protein [Pseudomonadales bacterium]